MRMLIILLCLGFASTLPAQVAEVDDAVVVDVVGVCAGWGCSPTEEEGEQEDAIGDGDGTVVVALAADEWISFTNIGNSIAVLIGFPIGDVALVGSVVLITVFRNSQQNVAHIDDAICVAIGLRRVVAGIGDTVGVAVCRSSSIDLAIVGNAVVIAVLGDAKNDVALIDDAVAVAIYGAAVFAFIGDVVAVAIGAGATGNFAFIEDVVVVAIEGTLSKIARVSNAVVIAVAEVAYHRAADELGKKVATA